MNIPGAIMLHFAEFLYLIRCLEINRSANAAAKNRILLSCGLMIISDCYDSHHHIINVIKRDPSRTAGNPGCEGGGDLSLERDRGLTLEQGRGLTLS